LATETRNATDEIIAQVSVIREATELATGGIAEISTAISEVEVSAAEVSVVIEKQVVVARQIIYSADEAASGVQESLGRIDEIKQATSVTSSGAEQVLGAAKTLSEDQVKLHSLVDRFLSSVEEIINERRLHERHPLHSDVYILHGGNRATARCIDVSAGGIAVEYVGQIEVGEQVSVEFGRDFDPIAGEVLARDEDRLRIRFDELLDLSGLVKQEMANQRGPRRPSTEAGGGLDVASAAA
ncbi:MAG: PilZ domain-containing protein, partial [Alphaproteobacteria bacterium]